MMKVLLDIYNFLQHLTLPARITKIIRNIMNQIKHNLPLILLASLVLKQLVHGIDASEMGVAIALSAIVSLKDYLEKQKAIQEVDAHVKKELEEVKHVIKTQNEVIEKMAKALDENRTSVASLKLSQGYNTRKMGA
jgi:hypothetical protein